MSNKGKVVALFIVWSLWALGWLAALIFDGFSVFNLFMCLLGIGAALITGKIAKAMNQPSDADKNGHPPNNLEN